MSKPLSKEAISDRGFALILVILLAALILTAGGAAVVNMQRARAEKAAQKVAQDQSLADARLKHTSTPKPSTTPSATPLASATNTPTPVPAVHPTATPAPHIVHPTLADCKPYGKKFTVYASQSAGTPAYGGGNSNYNVFQYNVKYGTAITNVYCDEQGTILYHDDGNSVITIFHMADVSITKP